MIATIHSFLHGSTLPWSTAEGGLADAGTWLAIGVGVGLVMGFLVGVSTAAFILHDRVKRKLAAIEAFARRR